MTQRTKPMLQGIRIIEIEGLGPGPFAAISSKKEKPRADAPGLFLDRIIVVKRPILTWLRE